MSITTISKSEVKAMRIETKVSSSIQQMVKFLINTNEKRSLAKAVEVASKLIIGLSMVTERLEMMPIAANITTSSGKRLMAELIMGPSSVINSQLANRGNQKMNKVLWLIIVLSLPLAFLYAYHLFSGKPTIASFMIFPDQVRSLSNWR